jgi:hypothetical protein
MAWQYSTYLGSMTTSASHIRGRNTLVQLVIQYIRIYTMTA